MTEKTEEKQRPAWRSWVAAIVGAALCFTVLSILESFGLWASAAGAAAIIVGGIWLLRTL